MKTSDRWQKSRKAAEEALETLSDLIERIGATAEVQPDADRYVLRITSPSKLEPEDEETIKAACGGHDAQYKIILPQPKPEREPGRMAKVLSGLFSIFGIGKRSSA